MAEKKAPKESKPKDEKKSTSKEYWVRQHMLDGKIVTGLVKADDKKKFLAECKKNGAEIDERDWFKKDNWQDRVYKKAKVIAKK